MGSFMGMKLLIKQKRYKDVGTYPNIWPKPNFANLSHTLNITQ